nr:MAG TPA: hypothetical protein [Caudoviricetes sp.]
MVWHYRSRLLRVERDKGFKPTKVKELHLNIE